MSGVWRISAALLLAFFAAFIAAPLAALSEGTDATLAICCRAHGKHHCTMGMTPSNAADQSSEEPAFKIVTEKCPYNPSSPVTAHSNTFQPGLQRLLFAEVIVHPTGPVQTEAKRRIAFDRSRQKRGPPTPFLSA